MPSRRALTEASFSFIDNRGTPATNSFPELLLRLGATERFDMAIRYVLADSAEGLFNKWLPSAVLRIPVTERWEVHAEWFGSWSDGLVDEKVRPFVGPGTHYLITPNLEIGCRMGWGLTQDAAAYFVDSGFGWRF